MFEALYLFNIFSPWAWIRLLNWLGTVTLLLANSVLVLSQDRFLGRIGWAEPEPYVRTPWQATKNSIIVFLNTVRRPLRVIVIPFNIIVIIIMIIVP